MFEAAYCRVFRLPAKTPTETWRTHGQFSSRIMVL
jgi:hypothetical protein